MLKIVVFNIKLTNESLVKMKKALLFVCFCSVIFLLSGCSGFISRVGFPSTFPGLILTEQISGNYIAPKLPSMKDVEVLGKVESEVSGANLLLLISEGNVSIKRAKEIALQKFPQADDVVNVEVDVKHRWVLGLFSTVTMYYRGVAIKYKK